jgi:phage gp36-like protein
MPAILPASYSSVQLVWDGAPFISSISQISSSYVASKIGEVEAEINAKISKRYAIPLTVECPILTAIATREAIYQIALSRALIHFPPLQQGRHPLYIQHLADQNMVNAIVTGSMQLVGVDGTTIDADTGNMELWSTTMNIIPTFNKGDILDQIQDNSMLQETRDDFDSKNSL